MLACKTKYLSHLAVAIFATAAFVSCFDHIGFYEYHAIDIDGWERNDFTDFNIPSAASSGYYTEIIGIRVNADYPFRTLDLIVEQNIISTTQAGRNFFKRDTMRLAIYDEDGRIYGTGVNLHQMEIPYKTIRLEKGDSIYMKIRHNMSRRRVKGISDIGLKVYLPPSSAD